MLTTWPLVARTLRLVPRHTISKPALRTRATFSSVIARATESPMMNAPPQATIGGRNRRIPANTTAAPATARSKAERVGKRRTRP
jgi:hypothetical protein